MKTVILNFRGRGGQLVRTLATAGLLMLGAQMAAAQQFKSPVGTWDFVLSGSGQQGLAFLTFVETTNTLGNGVFDGYEIITGPNNPPGSTDGRISGGDPDRNSTGETTTSTNAVSTNTLVFGFDHLKGRWGYDEHGRILGYYAQVLNSAGPSLNWLGTCMEAALPYPAAVLSGTNLVNLTATMNLDFCLTNSPFSTNVSWMSTNVDGSTNSFTAQFAFGASNSAVTLLYVNQGPAGITNTFTNFNFAFGSNFASFSTNALWTVTTLSGTNTPLLNLFSFSAETSTGPGIGTTTNLVSFTGTVTPGKRFVLVSSPSVSVAKVVFTGVPYRSDLPDLTGSWYGTKYLSGEPYLEFFDLASVADMSSADFTNSYFASVSSITNYPSIYYSTSGAGPGYTLQVMSMLSAQHRIAFSFVTIPDGSAGTNYGSDTFGTFTAGKTADHAVTRGVNEDMRRIRFNGTLITAP